MLNRYFEALEQPILKNGGDVLKLMGDGMLAIFPTPDDLTAEEGAALSALSAIEDARKLLAGSGVRFRAMAAISGPLALWRSVVRRAPLAMAASCRRK